MKTIAYVCVHDITILLLVFHAFARIRVCTLSTTLHIFYKHCASIGAFCGRLGHDHALSIHFRQNVTFVKPYRLHSFVHTLYVVCDCVSAVNGRGLQSVNLSSECSSASLYLDQHGASVGQLGVTIQNMTASHVPERCIILGFRHLSLVSALSSIVVSRIYTVHIGHLKKWPHKVVAEQEVDISPLKSFCSSSVPPV